MRDLIVQYPSLIAVMIAAVICVARTVFYPDDRRRNDLLSAVVALSLPFLAIVAGVLHIVTILRPEKVDLLIYRLDGLTGVQPSFLMGQLVQRHQWLAIAALMAYNLTPVAVVLVFSATLWRRPEAEMLELVRTFGWNTVAAIPIYLIIPVAGPVYQFPSFPHLPASMPLSSMLAAPPNGVPSIHLSTALLVLWFARHWLAGWLAALIFLGLTIVATLGSGEHYLFDLVVAVPYSAAVYQLGSRQPRPVPVEALADAG